jgi:hypothetical protein
MCFLVSEVRLHGTGPPLVRTNLSVLAGRPRASAAAQASMTIGGGIEVHVAPTRSAKESSVGGSHTSWMTAVAPSMIGRQQPNRNPV